MQFLNADQEPVEYDGSPIAWRVSAYAVIEKNNEIFIIKNKTEKLHDIVGGGIEIGETIEEALQRECLEEGGITIHIGRLLHAHIDWFHHKSGTFFQTCQLFYSATIDEYLDAPTHETTEWRGFVPVSEIGKKYRLPPIVEQVTTKNS
ncbi:MAG: NUDIX domain-containing protein [Microgenomates group bacterium]